MCLKWCEHSLTHKRMFVNYFEGFTKPCEGLTWSFFIWKYQKKNWNQLPCVWYVGKIHSRSQGVYQNFEHWRQTIRRVGNIIFKRKSKKIEQIEANLHVSKHWKTPSCWWEGVFQIFWSMLQKRYERLENLF